MNTDIKPEQSNTPDCKLLKDYDVKENTQLTVAYQKGAFIFYQESVF